MTIEDLIKDLQRYPKSMDVVISVDVCGTEFIHEIKWAVEHERRNGTLVCELAAGGFYDEQETK